MLKIIWKTNTYKSKSVSIIVFKTYLEKYLKLFRIGFFFMFLIIQFYFWEGIFLYILFVSELAVLTVTWLNFESCVKQVTCSQIVISYN